MYIKKIKIENFRNYEKEEIILNEKSNIIYGDNAQGKTNILESIFVCSLGKSFRTNQEKELIKIGKEFSKIEIEYEKEDRKGKINYILNKEKKEFFINDLKIKKISDILGNIYIVLFTPGDINILKNEPAKRRRFLNIMISQLRPIYVHTLNKYNKALEQKNMYIKQIKNFPKDENILDVWDEQLAILGNRIYNYRKEFIEKINKKIKEIHLKTTEGKEEIFIKYKTNVKEDYFNLLKNNRKEDIKKGYTSIGVHRDDFEIYINKIDVSKYGSQGQQRTAIISLKLAEAEVIYEEIGERPVILLDDFMSELDNKRIKAFINNIKENQTIVTGTNNIKFDEIEYNTYKIENAKIIKEEKNGKV